MAELYRNLFMAVGACGLLVLLAYALQKNKKVQLKNPKYFTQYRTTKYTAGQCRDILQNKNIHDTFAYTIAEGSKGTEITFTNYYPTNQIMETVFLLEVKNQQPAEISLTFLREAFGSRKPVIPQELLDDFFAAKLDCIRVEQEGQSV